jgi:hypothetical protein
MTRKHGHYYRPFPFRDIDFYRLALVYSITDPCVQHVIKKLLALGRRGAKDDAHDVQDCIDTLERWKEMRAEEAAIAASPEALAEHFGVDLAGWNPTKAIVDEFGAPGAAGNGAPGRSDDPDGGIDVRDAADALTGLESLSAFRTDGAFRFGGRDLEVVTARDQDPATVTISAPRGLVVGTGTGSSPRGLIVALDPAAPREVLAPLFAVDPGAQEARDDAAAEAIARSRAKGRGFGATIERAGRLGNVVARQVENAAGTGLVDATYRAATIVPGLPGVYARLYETYTTTGTHFREYFCWWDGAAWSAGRFDFYSASLKPIASAAGQVARPWRGQPGTDLPFAKDPAP